MEKIITEDFTKKYQNIIPKWGFNGLGYIVYKRTYARKKENGELEEWIDTLTRCINGAQKIGAKYTKEEAERLFDYIFNLKCNFAGRMLWQLGTSTVDRFGANSLLNCFAFSTEILTDQGIKEIGSLVGNKVKLMTRYGKWVDSEIKSFGKQKIFKIKLQRGAQVFKEIFTTKNHRWFRNPRRTKGERHLESYIECTTLELLEKDSLAYTYGQSVKSISEISRYGIIHGLVFGDGSVCNNVGQLTLCGEKNKELLNIFTEHKIYSLGNGHLCVANLPKYFKESPRLDMDKSYLYGWLSGYFAADGNISEAGNVRIHSAKKENLLLVRDVCSRLGIGYSPITVQKRIGIGQEIESDLFSISINPSFLTEDFFLLSHHKHFFCNNHYKEPLNWRVVSVEETDREEVVYCAIVPDTHSFVIEGNILTGNCWYCNISSIDSFCFLYENLMLGGGCGYSIRREDIHELPRVKFNVNITIRNTKDADFIVPDSREGWIALLRKLLESFFVTGKGFSFSTILIRSAGEPIKGFGGTSSGPKILEDGMTNIAKVIKNREGKKLRSVDCLDVCNIIGSIVVAGNTRRSAQIAIGDPDDILFLKAKRWDLGNIPNWRAMSNNTIYADDYDHIMENVWDGYGGNGEPYGFFNLNLSQTNGRLGEKIKDNCSGLNPCVSGNTKIYIKENDKILEKNIAELVNTNILAWNGFEWSEVIPKVTGYDQPVYRITLNNKKELVCTSYHKWILSDGTRIETKRLQVGDRLLIGYEPNLREYELKPTYPYDLFIEEIKYLGIEKVVYCFEEKRRHFGVFNGILTGQCGEISLSHFECCNLSELYLNNISSKEELLDCAKLLYKTQKAVCSMNFLHDETTKIVHKNFRIGIGVTGICQSFNKLDWLDWTYKEIKKFDKEWSKQNNYPESIKITTCKPSGSVSLLSGSTPGVHPAFAKYYIRRIRMASSDSLVEICKSLGYQVEFVKNYDLTLDRGTVIISFPCFAGENVIIAKDMSAIDQLNLVKKMQTIWADNAVSCTVYYKKEEIVQIKNWLKENYKTSIKSISFLLHSDHGFEQAPYEEITKEKYDELIEKCKPISSLLKIEGESFIDNLECSNGVCPIK